MLHPWSWLFALLAQMRQFLFPLLALLLFGQRAIDRDSRIQLVLAIAVVAALVATALLRYFTYRYRIGSDSLSVRSGLLARNRREIPFARIHNVAVHQNLLHRLFGVAELRLESAGSRHPEAEMRVLRYSQAMALEQLVRQHARGAGAAPAQAPVDDATRPAADAAHHPTQGQLLLALRAADLLRLGLVSNRGMVVALAAFGTLTQLVPREVLGDYIRAHGREVAGLANQVSLSTRDAWLLGGGLLLVMLALTRLLSVVLAFVQYHGFVLVQDNGRLTVERGLLSRLRSSVGRGRIQAWSLYQGLLQRWLGVCQLKVDIAAGNPADNNSRALRELAPIAATARCRGLVAQLAPELAWPAQWQPLDRRQFWRLALPSLLWLPLATAGLWQLAGSWALLALLALPWSLLASWRWLQHAGYWIDARCVAVRGGWLRRWWKLAPTAKVQALRLQRSPLDRLCGTASLVLDTAGAGAGRARLQVPLLPLARAQELLDGLAAAISRPRPRAAPSAAGSTDGGAPVTEVLADLQPAQPG